MTFDGDGEQCVICVHDFLHGEDCVRLRCGHSFHHTCWANYRQHPHGRLVDDMNVALRDKCPICRRRCNERPDARWIFRIPRDQMIQPGRPAGARGPPEVSNDAVSGASTSGRVFTAAPGAWTSTGGQVFTIGAPMMPTAKRPPPPRPEAPVQVKAAPPGTIPDHILAAANLWNRSTPQAKAHAKAAPPPLRLPPTLGAGLRPLERSTANSSQGSLRSEPARPLTPTTHGLLGPPIRQPSSDPGRGSRLSENGDSQQTGATNDGDTRQLDENLPSGSGIQRSPLPRIDGVYNPELGYTPGVYPRQTPEASPRYSTDPPPDHSIYGTGSQGPPQPGRSLLDPDPGSSPHAAGSGSNDADTAFAGVIVGDSEQWGCETFLGIKPGQEALHDKWQKTIKNLPRREPQRSGNETSLSNGKVALLVDIGSYGNLAGDRWLASLAKVLSCAGRPLESIQQIERDKALTVSGVGSGSQVCNYNTHIPIAIPTQDGTISATLKTPTVPNSDLPGLLGLQSLRQARTIIDTETNKLYMLGPGDYDMMKIMPPGTTVVQLEESPSGHLMMPCDQYNQFDIEQRNGGLVLDKQISLPVQATPSSKSKQQRTEE